MIRSLLALEGVIVVCRFRDDGALEEGHGLVTEEEMARLARFAHDYRRMLQANADQLSMFTQVSGWTPPQGWVVRSLGRTVCSVGNVVCVASNEDCSLNSILEELQEVARY